MSNETHEPGGDHRAWIDIDQDEEEATRQQIKAWHQLAQHPLFRGCYASDLPLITAMINRLDEVSTSDHPAGGAR